MNGADYIAKVRISGEDDETLAAPGEACDAVPSTSLGWLLEQGYIIAAADAVEVQ